MFECLLCVGRFFADHASVMCTLGKCKPDLTVKSISYRKFKSIDTQCLRDDTAASTLFSEPAIQDHLATAELDALVRIYQDTLTNVINRHAPIKTRAMVARPKVSRYNEEIDKAKGERRKAERIWRKTRSLYHLKRFKMKRNLVVFLMNKDKRVFYTEFVRENGNDQGRLCKAAKTLSKKEDLSFPIFSFGQ